MFKLVRDSELRINLFARQGTREMKFNQGWGGGGGIRIDASVLKSPLGIRPDSKNAIRTPVYERRYKTWRNISRK